jgi:hypothetical protein
MHFPMVFLYEQLLAYHFVCEHTCVCVVTFWDMINTLTFYNASVNDIKLLTLLTSKYLQNYLLYFIPCHHINIKC